MKTVTLTFLSVTADAPPVPNAPAPSLAVVAPAFNEEDNVGLFVAAFAPVLGQMQAAGQISQWRLLLVDDGSTDATADRVGEQMRVHPQVTLLRLGQNRGYAGALNAGLGACAQDWVLLTDADLPFDPAELPGLWQVALAKRADVLAAYRLHRWRQEPKRALMSVVYGLLVRWRHGLAVRDPNCACKLVRREVLRSVLPLHSRSLFVDPELLIRARRAGFSLLQAPIHYQARRHGQSTLGGWRHVRETFREVWSFPEG